MHPDSLRGLRLQERLIRSARKQNVIEVVSMPVSLSDITQKREEIHNIARRHGALRVRIFGSVARGDEERGSDVDFLVAFRAGTSLLDHIGLVQELEDLLGCHVDVVTENSLKERMRSHVLKDAVEV